MTYRITRADGGKDHITLQDFESYDDAYDLLEQVYGDMCCSDADYEDRPYYEIVKLKAWAKWKRIEQSKLQTFTICTILFLKKENFLIQLERVEIIISFVYYYPWLDH